MTAALGGIHADVFCTMSDAERRSVLGALVGHEIRCIVCSKGAGGDRRHGDCLGTGREGARDDGEEGWSGVSKYRIERLAAADPAADLSLILSENS